VYGVNKGVQARIHIPELLLPELSSFEVDSYSEVGKV
jgi:hypothetical protein